MAGSQQYKPDRMSSSEARALECLPAEHQMFFLSPHRFAIHEANLSDMEFTDLPDIKFARQELKEVKMSMLNPNLLMTERARAMIMCIGLSRFYDPDLSGELNPDLPGLVTSLLTLLGTYTNASFFKTNSIGQAMKSSSFTLTTVVYPSYDALAAAAKPYMNRFIRYLGAETFEDIIPRLPIIALTIFVVIGKNITDASRDAWFRKRWAAWALSCNQVFPYYSAKIPEEKACNSLYIFIRAHSAIRTAIFETYRALSKKPGRHSDYFQRILNLLKWTEMSHMPLIMHHIFDKNKDLLQFSELSGEKYMIHRAMEFMIRYPNEDRPFLKLLLPDRELRVLESSNFRYFTAAARAVAKLTNPNMNLSRTERDVAWFEAMVTNYVKGRRQICEK